jgi:DNA-binding response OmpR family regulator
MRILLADLDTNLLAVLRNNLTTLGYHVETTDHGGSAIEMIRQTIFQVVIAGDELSDMSGLEFCHKVRGNIQTHGNYLILMPRQRPEQLAGELALPDAVLIKPFGMVQLIAALLVAERRMSRMDVMAA